MEGEEGGPMGWGGCCFLPVPLGLRIQVLADDGFWVGTEANPRGLEVGKPRGHLQGGIGS